MGLQRAVSNRNDKTLPYKDVRLSKLDMRFTGQVYRAQDDKETIPILL